MDYNFFFIFLCLESLGMLDESLKRRLKVCSEISLLRYAPLCLLYTSQLYYTYFVSATTQKL